MSAAAAAGAAAGGAAAAASASASASPPGAASARGSKADFSRMWGDERLADVTIRIKIKGHERQEEQEQEQDAGPPAKRARSEAEAEEGGAAVETLRAHGTVLVQRSAYFDRMLLGSGALLVEGQTRTLTVELEDEQDAADFKRMIKLSYGPSYTVEDGQPLTKAELLRLLVTANGFEMLWCVEECAQALLPFAGYDEAMAYFQSLPDTLLWTAPLRATTEAAGDELAEALGPVEKLWRPGERATAGKKATLIMDPLVVQLPVGGVEALLRSEKLQLKSENCTFSLALWWVEAQPGSEEERQPCFNRLLESLRFGRMSCDFLAVLTTCKWVERSGLLPLIMARSISRRDVVTVVGLPPSRARPVDRKEYKLTFSTRIDRADVEGAQAPSPERSIPLGLAHGFPFLVNLVRGQEGKLGFHFAKDQLFESEAASGELARALKGSRSIRCRFAHGHLGGVALQAAKSSTTGPGDPHPAHALCAFEDIPFDGDGKVPLQLALTIMQHPWA